ncbi:MAG: HAD-IA family hydrolase [Ilumatobacteraceae bacterium]
MSAPARRHRAHPPAAVLWDMDGTIVDTEPYWIATEYELVAEFGGHWSDEKAHSLVGLDLRDSAAILRDRGGVDLPIDDIVNRLLDGVIARIAERVPWRPGARELLADLQREGIPTALVTMSWRRFALAVVDILPPGTFTTIVTGDVVSKGKPHPEPYLAAAAALGVDARDCVAIEDSPTGVRSAVAAGCRTLAVPNVVDIPPGDGYERFESLVEVDLALLGIEHRRTPPARRRLAALALAIAALAGGAWWVTRAEAPPQPLATVPVSGWVPYWTLDDALPTVQNHGPLMRELSPFWYSARGAQKVGLSGTLEADDIAAMSEALRASGALVIPSVVDEMGAGRMAAVLADPARRANHVRTLVALVTDGGHDGLDLDYETFAWSDGRDTWEATRPNWVAFVTELGAELHARGKRLVVTIPPVYPESSPQTGAWVYDPAAIAPHVDTIRVMAYDFSTSAAGPIAPLTWVREVAKGMVALVGDRSKVVLGIPTYGRNWVVATSGTCPDSAQGTVPVTQDSALAVAARRGAVPTHDVVTGESWFVYQLTVEDGGVSCVQSREVHWVDEQGVRSRIDIAREERLGGVSLWAIGFDSDALWPTISDLATP